MEIFGDRLPTPHTQNLRRPADSLRAQSFFDQKVGDALSAIEMAVRNFEEHDQKKALQLIADYCLDAKNAYDILNGKIKRLTR